MTDLEKLESLKEAASLLERLKGLIDEHGPLDSGDMFSIHGSGAHSTVDGRNMLGVTDITTELMAGRVAKALNKRVGTRCTYSTKDVADIIKSSVRTIEHMKHGSGASVQNLFRLIAFFGPEFASEIFAPLGMTVVESDSAQAAQSLSIEGLTEMLPQIRNYIDIIAGTLNLEGDANED